MQSQSLDLPVKLIVDPKVDIEETYRPSEILFKGPADKSIFKYTATTATDSQLVFNNIVPSSLSTCVERTLRLQYQIVFTCKYDHTVALEMCALALDNTDNNALIGLGQNNVCLRAFPLQSCISSIELRLNGNQTSFQSYDMVSLYPHLLDQDEIQEFSSEFPCQKAMMTMQNIVYLQLQVANVLIEIPSHLHLQIHIYPAEHHSYVSV